jgi:hypothetical protein
LLDTAFATFDHERPDAEMLPSRFENAWVVGENGRTLPYPLVDGNYKQFAVPAANRSFWAESLLVFRLLP